MLSYIFVLVGVYGFPCCPGPKQSQHLPVFPAPLVTRPGVQPLADVLPEHVLQGLPVAMVDCQVLVCETPLAEENEYMRIAQQLDVARFLRQRERAK